MRLARVAVTVCGLLGVAVTARAQGLNPLRCEVTDDATVGRLQHDIEYLASDALGGRETGTVGNEQAAQFLVTRLTELGVAPEGTDGYRQPFRVEMGVEATAGSALLLRARGETRVLTYGTDFRVAHAPPFSGNGRAVGALVYAGHGLYSREAHWDDFARGVPVRGRVVVVLSGRPRPTDPTLVANLDGAHIVGSLVGKVRAARERGAAGLIEIQLDPSEPVETFISPPGTGIPVVRITRAQGAWLLGRSEAQLVAETTEVHPSRVEGGSARVVSATRRRWVTTHNILGVVRARASADAGVATSRGVVVVGAHYDHIGRGGWGSLAPGLYGIHNGADDNGSGTAALLELARRVARAPLSRDVVFTWFGAEELGLVGSRWMVAHRPDALGDVAAMINMDMIGRLRECRLFVESRDTARGFQALIDEVGRGSHFNTLPWEPFRGSWGASDHMSFVDARVPGLFLFTGLHDDYHRPSDDPPTLNYRGLGAVTGYAERLLRGLVDAMGRDPRAFSFAR